MNLNSLKNKYFIILSLLLTLTTSITLPKKTKGSPQKRSGQPCSEIPNDNELFQSVINRTDLNGTKLSALSIKDLFKVYEVYVRNFVKEEDPFSWDLKRLDLFTQIFDHYSKSNQKLSLEIHNFKDIYHREFGIFDSQQLSQTLQILARATHTFHQHMDQNRNVPALIKGINQFVGYLKKNLPGTFAKRIGNLESAITAELHLGLISKINRRMKS
ncbi:MAG TPA: hypothetical protein VJ201_04905 [Candidatus Babeliales bacterium]|nr:hypothetical protein [Candidatus Babeliales bacterium]